MRTYATSEIDELDEAIRRISQGVGKDFPDVDPEDLGQSLWEFVLTKQIGPEHSGLRTLLRKQAKDLAWQQRKEYLALTAQYAYRESDVRKLLETMRMEDWRRGYLPRDAREGQGDWEAPLDVHIDVLIGLRSLTGVEYRAILSRYQPPIVIPEYGSTAAKVLTRAVRNLTKHMNTYPRSRAIRRSSAQVRADMEDYQ